MVTCCYIFGFCLIRETGLPILLEKTKPGSLILLRNESSMFCGILPQYKARKDVCVKKTNEGLALQFMLKSV
jgi:hypothetical protein